MRKPHRDRITQAALLLQQRNFPDVAKYLLAQDIKTKPKSTQARARRVDVATRYGDKARGGSKGFVSAALIDAALKEEGR